MSRKDNYDNFDRINNNFADEEKEKKRRKKRLMQKIDRIFGYFLATGIILGISALCLEYIIVKGPSLYLKDAFVGTMLETRRFHFISRIFLTEEEVNLVYSGKLANGENHTDVDMINIPSEGESVVDETGKDAYGLVDDDGDGLIFVDVKGNGFVGKMIVILDPSRVFVGCPELRGAYGETLEQMVTKAGALGGINAGGFLDENGAGTGGIPEGVTISQGQLINDIPSGASAAFDEQGILHVGYFGYQELVDKGVRDCVSFGPPLIINGAAEYIPQSTQGVNPRTAVGQRADGAVLLLAIDGRQVHSIGATHQDLINIMFDFGAVNACNMDGGSSTMMYYDGEYINKRSSIERYLPSSILFK